MTDFYLSKSGYCRALRCPKILWLDRRKPEAKAETAAFVPERFLEGGGGGSDLTPPGERNYA